MRSGKGGYFVEEGGVGPSEAAGQEELTCCAEGGVLQLIPGQESGGPALIGHPLLEN